MQAFKNIFIETGGTAGIQFSYDKEARRGTSFDKERLCEVAHAK